MNNIYEKVESIKKLDLICGHCNIPVTMSEYIKNDTMRVSKIGDPKIYKCPNCDKFTLATFLCKETGLGGRCDFILADYVLKPNNTRIFLSQIDIIDDRNECWNNYNIGSYKSATILARSILQKITRLNDCKGKNLHEEIENLYEKGLITECLKNAMISVKALGNDVAHPSKECLNILKENCKELLEVIDLLIEMVIELPEKTANLRKSHKENKNI
jgi:predicted transcriptional regulator